MRLLFLILSLTFFIQFSGVFAEEMQSPNYRLDLEPVEEKAPETEEVVNNEPRMIPENLYNAFQQQGFVILTEDADLQKEIVFDLSKTAVSFETNAANVTDEVVISVSAVEVFGYELQLIKKKSLMHTSTQDTIVQTQCDDKQNPCTVRVAQPWKQEPTYGIGYNLQGEDVPRDFADETYFRPFPEAEDVTLMQNNHVLDMNEGKMVIKLNADPTQAEGSYEGIYELRMIPKI